MTLEALPGWADEINRRREQITEAGLNGLLGAHAVTMPLGEALARGQIGSAELDAWVKTKLAPKVEKTDELAQPSSVDATTALLKRIATDPHVFWRELYSLKFPGVKFTLPPMKRIKTQICARIDSGCLLPIFLTTGLTQDAYPEGWVRSDWGRYFEVGQIKHHPLPGRWVVIELIRKPDWNDGSGYGDGNDRLARKLGLQTRFITSWDHLRDTLCPHTAQFWGLKKMAIRFLTAEEWNLFGNVLLELNRLHEAQFQDLGATTSWEWSENTYGSGGRVIVGSRGGGGLAAVSGGLVAQSQRQRRLPPPRRSLRRLDPWFLEPWILFLLGCFPNERSACSSVANSLDDRFRSSRELCSLQSVASHLIWKQPLI